MDFTLKTFSQLVEAIKKKGYSFQTFQNFIQDPSAKSIVFRHDVDRLPGNALVIAELEERSGVRGSYYFRSVKESFDERIIKKIAGMGHEVGYHYENLAEVGKRKESFSHFLQNPKSETLNRSKESEVRSKKEESFSTSQPLNPSTSQILYKLSIEDFVKNLKRFRTIVPVKTICMHGSPTSKYDSRDLWKVYDYRDFGIIGEPYFDIDFSKVLYLTDTGRRWNGDKFNIRDKVIRQGARGQGLGEELSNTSKPLTSHLSPITTHYLPDYFHSTFDIINALGKNLLPDQIMINTHPQRWTDSYILWIKELVWQNVKNVVKRFYV